ncbi:780_t:CDS:2, partial [Paraglomus occultum]
MNEEVKELVARPSLCNPFAELEMQNIMLRDQKAELDEQLLGAMQQMFKNAEAKTSELQNLLKNEVTRIRATLTNNENTYSVQLVKDIVKLQNKLKEFTQLDNEQIALIEQRVTGLLQNYQCLTGSPTKSIVSGVLQRYIIEKVLTWANAYFKLCIEDLNKKTHNELAQCNKDELDKFLEGNILRITANLYRSIKEFSKRRNGEDELTHVMGAKIHQQVYAVLGSCGFASVDHLFVVKAVKTLLNELDKYRQFKDQSKKKDTEELASSIILETVCIFHFKFQAQVPVVEYHFFESRDKFDPMTMECIQEDDEDGEKQFVEICSFPLIGANIFTLDKGKRQIFSRAKVQLRLDSSID